MPINPDAGSPPVRWAGISDPVGTNITSAAFTPESGSLLVLVVSADTQAGINITVAVSDSLAGSWTNRVERDPGDGGAQNGHVSIWTRAVSGAGASMTVSVNRASGDGGTHRVSARLYIATGVDLANPIGATGEGSSTTNNLSAAAYTSTVDQSRGVGGGTDWNQLGAPTSTDTEDGADYAGQISVVSLYKAADTTPSGTAVTMNFDAAGAAAAAWNWVAMELRPADASLGARAGLGPGWRPHDRKRRLRRPVAGSTAVTAVDARSSSVVERLGLRETGTASKGARTAVLERLGLRETGSAQKGALATVLERLGLRETNTARKGALVTLLERLGLRETDTARKGALATVLERLGMRETDTASKGALATVLERLGLRETNSATQAESRFSAVLERLGLRETGTASKGGRAAVVERLGLRETAAARKGALSSVLERLGLRETGTARKGALSTIVERLGLRETGTARKGARSAVLERLGLRETGTARKGALSRLLERLGLRETLAAFAGTPPPYQPVDQGHGSAGSGQGGASSGGLGMGEGSAGSSGAGAASGPLDGTGGGAGRFEQ